ncbi:hypothetical protein MBH78_14820 [Oceanimonas sp. NS1]|nr:hypothetical protein [Oceanimonas sp. NS1]
MTSELASGRERYQQTLWNLIFPRDVRLPLPEFAKPEAIEYFTRNKTAMLGHSFEQAAGNPGPPGRHARRPRPAGLAAAAFERADKRLGWDDIHFFPTLRNLTMVSAWNLALGSTPIWMRCRS